MEDDGSFYTSSQNPPGSKLDPTSTQRHRPLFLLTLAFAFGIWLDDVLKPGLPILGGGFLAGILGALTFGTRLTQSTHRRRVYLALAGVIGIWGGLLTHALNTRHLESTHVSRLTPATPSLSWMKGKVLRVHRATGGKQLERWTLSLSALGSAKDQLHPATGRVQITIQKQINNSSSNEDKQVAEGDRLLLFVRLEAPARATLPGTFDAAAYLSRNGILRVGEPAKDDIEILGQVPYWRFDLWLRRWGGALAKRNESFLMEQQAALLNALTLGRKEGLEYSDREAFSKAGTAHLLAISGLHIHGFAVLLWWLLSVVGVSRRRSAGIIIAGVICFAAMTGAQASAVRAALMVSIYAFGMLLRRPPDALSTLGAAGLLILFFQPDQLFLAGFQLSFMAVLALITLYPSLECAWVRWRAFPEFLVMDPAERKKLVLRQRIRRTILVSFSAWVGTAPAVAWHMGFIAPLSVFSNLIAVPLTTVAMLCGIPGMLLGIGWLGAILCGPLIILLGFNRWVASFEFSSISVFAPHPLLCLAIAGILFWAWVERGRSATLPRLGILLPAAFIALMTSSVFRAPVEGPRVTILDLSSGRATLIETPTGEAALIDTGNERQGRRVVESLRRQKIHALALLVITEDRNDAVGGAHELLKHIRIHRVMLPRTSTPSQMLRKLEIELSARNIPFSSLNQTSNLHGPNGIAWQFFTDSPTALPKKGSESLCVHLRLPGGSMLLANARSGASLRRLMANHNADLKADILRVIPGPLGYWPPETKALIASCGARTLVAGQGRGFLGEGTGLDLVALSRAQGLRLLSLRNEGSLRFNDINSGEVFAYQEGNWRALKEQ